MNRLIVVLVMLAACGGGSELDEDQGPCEGLDEETCTADARCQQSYVDSGFQPEPFVLTCLRLRSGTVDGACEALDFDGCRTREDCSPLFWQDLDGTDRPVGDPYYRMCTTEP